MTDWKPKDWIVLGLVTIIGVCVFSAIINAIVKGDIDDDRAAMIRDIIVSLVTIVSMYIGAKLRSSRSNGE